MKNSNKISVPIIYIKAVFALMFIQLGHKAVREIPHVLSMVRVFPKVGLIFFTSLLIFGMIGVLCRFRWGLILGIVGAGWMLLQPFLVHVIMKMPAADGIWWYPIFPITQAVLIIYFSLLVWQKDKKVVNLT
jgi:hypothetical protein